MFCSHCGTQLPDDAKFCQNCGTAQNVQNAESAGSAADSIKSTVNDAFDRVEEQAQNEFNNMRNTFQNVSAPYRGERLQTDRSLAIYIIFGLLTCGIYCYYFIYKMARDVNIACDGDGQHTPGLVEFILLSICTCGIYAIIWYYKLANRLADNAYRYGMNFQENGTTVLMWFIFGVFVCGIGPFIGMSIVIKNTNRICQGYNDLFCLI